MRLSGTMAAAVELAEAHPSEFTLQYPPRREYFRERFRAAPDWKLLTSDCGEEILLYVHVPFCGSKCAYCNFAVDIRVDREVHNAYVGRLITQLDQLLEWTDGKLIRGIDIGGGTPTLLHAEALTRILDTLKPWMARTTGPRALSVETTPDIAARHPERLAALAAGGVGRMSVGLQSAVPDEIALVGRAAQQGMAERAVETIREAGIERINVDLIFGLPGQNEDDWLISLDHAISLRPTSVTTYDCLYRGKGRALSKRHPQRPTAEQYGRLYALAHKRLGEAGFAAPYGSVNFSRVTGETGTSAYFEGRLLDGLPYLGIGNYASSQIGSAWGFAPLGVRDWQSAIDKGDVLPMQDAYHLPTAELMAKQLLLSLNFGFIDAERFERRFGEPIRLRFGRRLDVAVERGWLTPADGKWLVRPGCFSDLPKIRALFYTNSAIDWLRGLLVPQDET